MGKREERLKLLLEKKLKEQTSDPMLPEAGRVEQNVVGRTDMLGEFTKPEGLKQNILKGLIKNIPGPVGQVATGLSGMGAIGGPFQRAEAGAVNPLMEIQAGKAPTLDSVFAGLKGEKLGEAGDLIRTTGIGKDLGVNLFGRNINANELAANLIGFTAVAGATDFATNKLLSNGAMNVKNGLQKSFKRSAVFDIKAKRAMWKQKADMFIKGIDDSFKGMRHEYGELFQKIGGNKLTGADAGIVQNSIDDLSKIKPGLIDSIQKAAKARGMKAPGVGKVFDSGRISVLSDDLNTAKLIQKEIGRAVNQKVWSGIEIADDVDRKLMSEYFKIGDALASSAGESAPKLKQLNARMSSLFDFNAKLSPQLRTSKGTTKTTIRNIHSEAMQGNLDDAIKFSNKFFKQGRYILDDITRIKKWQRIKTAIGGRATSYGLSAGIGATVGSLLSRRSGDSTETIVNN